MEVEVPPPVDEDATVAFLGSDGDLLVVFVAETADLFLVDVTEIGACETVAAGLDNAVAAPVVLSELASNVPDPVTSDLFLSDIALKTKLLGACGTDDASGLVAEVAWQSELLERRLVELGVEW